MSHFRQIIVNFSKIFRKSFHKNIFYLKLQESTEQLVEIGDNGVHDKEEGKPSGGGGGGPLEEKVKRLESLLSKCKENIKANKQKTAALTEVKEQLASDLALREKELAEEKAKAQDVNAQMELLKGRY